MKSLLRQIKISFERETLLFALLKIFRYGFYLVRSLPLRWSLDAPGLYIGPKFLLLGTKHLNIGKNFYAHSNLWIEAIPEYKTQKFSPSITIGDNVSMGDAVHISCNNKVNIGNNVLFGSNIFVGDHQHGCYSGPNQSHIEICPALRPLSISQGIDIGDNTWIANNVVITGGVTIGRSCIIAANSLVNQDFTEGTLVAGSPARAIKRFDAESNSWVKI
ncbi:DapH/DapD/GlmU-related protein [Variovorax sp. PCZ-1]|uniref:DapH/DapD/GlmU-related protein n=1 Tax=Variovorax sp. PCZ-1 TaxID=2835533 RepID=UPI001BCAA929|nr:DapH/DapD/GlmU-related protein [Variovorax sp. PCZ-1]MBS7808575.1 hypothetical protein [Variovorax sp. PCZ-1]